MDDVDEAALPIPRNRIIVKRRDINVWRISRPLKIEDELWLGNLVFLFILLQWMVF